MHWRLCCSYVLRNVIIYKQKDRLVYSLKIRMIIIAPISDKYWLHFKYTKSILTCLNVWTTNFYQNQHLKEFRYMLFCLQIVPNDSVHKTQTSMYINSFKYWSSLKLGVWTFRHVKNRFCILRITLILFRCRCDNYHSNF